MKRLAVLVLLISALLSGCAARPSGSRYAPSQENRLVIYTSHKPDVYAPIIQEFEARTGIWAVVEAGGTNEMLERIKNEKSAPRADLMFGGGVESLEAYSDCFAGCPADTSAVYPDYLNPGSKWLPFSSLPQVLIYNPKLVDSPPEGWESLLDKRWRGSIAFADPEVSGSSFTALATMLQVLPMEAETTLELFTQNLAGRILPGSGDVVEAVANGSCLIGVTLEETAMKGMAAGADIAMVYPKEGTSAVPDGIAVTAGCAHPENAERFIAFILENSMQRRLGGSFSRRPVLKDLLITEAATQGLVLCEYDIGWAGREKNALLAQWKEWNREAGQ